MSAAQVPLVVDSHVRMLEQFVCALPQQYESLDPNRMTLLHFTVCALDILQQCPRSSSSIIEWVYAQQQTQGFTAGPSAAHTPYAETHIAMTYSALCILRTLGDNLHNIHKHNIIDNLKILQTQNGSFRCLARPAEDDMRFVYCA
jgi:geranylgeranyl transferase type-1 subunit beta